MKISAKFAKETILNKNGLNHLQIEVTPPVLEKTGDRKPVLMVFVIDRSGSMSDIVSGNYEPIQQLPYPNPYGSGYAPNFFQNNPNYGIRTPFYPIHPNQRREFSSKMDYAVNSTIKFLGLLTNKDMVGIIAYDDIAEVIQPLTTVNGDNTNQIASNVRTIIPRGCTNISDGLLKAKGLITQDHLDKYNCKIVLLSDGLVNRGIRTIDGLTDIAIQCAKQGISISTLGIGLDYESAVMGSIAQGGGGLIHHIEDLSKLEDIFKEELELSTIISAKNIKVLIEIPSLIEVGENLNSYVQTVNGSSIEILLGDMYNSRKIIMEIRNNFVNEDVAFNIKALYKDLDGNEGEIKTTALLKVVDTQEEHTASQEDKEIISSVYSLIKDKTIEQTSDLYQKGDLVSVQAQFNSSANVMRGMSLAYSQNVCASAAMAELNSVSQTFTSGNASISEAKDMYAKSNRARRDN